jgi:hypothetical protein
MNKKLIGTTALAVVAVGGYLYYQRHMAEIQKRVQQFEDKANDLFIGYLAKRQEAEYQKPTDE